MEAKYRMKAPLSKVEFEWINTCFHVNSLREIDNWKREGVTLGNYPEHEEEMRGLEFEMDNGRREPGSEVVDRESVSNLGGIPV